MIDAIEEGGRRKRFVRRLYDLVEGSQEKFALMLDVGASLRFDRETTERVVLRLVDEGRVKLLGTDHVGISHAGLLEVERDGGGAPMEVTERPWRFLVRLYELSEGRSLFTVGMYEIGDALGYERAETDNICDYWEGEGAIKFANGGMGSLSITVAGVTAVEEYLHPQDESASGDARDVFIVHGHDELNTLKLKELLRDRWGLNPIVLSTRAGRGRTLIEKFEQEAAPATYAFVLMTPDDLVEAMDGSYAQARPNVVFELGWFCGRVGRERTCIILKRGTRIHSDLDGISRIEFSENVEEKVIEIERELKALLAQRPGAVQLDRVATGSPQQLSQAAQGLLLEAEAHDGEFVWSPGTGVGEAVWVRGGRTFSDESAPAVAARYIDAFQELQRLDLVRYRSGVVYCLTGSGYTKARELKTQGQREAVSDAIEKWVDAKYPQDAGIVKAEEAAGFRVSWCREEDLARKLDLEGCEVVERAESDGKKVIFKIKDRPSNLVLIRKKQ